MLYMIVNILVMLVFFICLYVANTRNLFQCALLLGQTFFSFLLAVTLAPVVAKALEGSFAFSPASIRGVVCCAIWLVVLLSFEPVARNILRESGRQMNFHQSWVTPGRLVLGFVSSFFVAGAFSLSMVMLPVVEGSYIEDGKNAHVLLSVHEKAAGIYVAIECLIGTDRTVEDFLRETQVQAGIEAVKNIMKQKQENNENYSAESYINALKSRYGARIKDKDVETLRAGMY